MGTYSDSPYPRWDAQLEANRDALEREIEEWYKVNADTAGHAPAFGAAGTSDSLAANPHFPSQESSWFERFEDEAKVLYRDVKAKLAELFAMHDTDDETKAEYQQAFQDEAHWQGHVRSSAEKLQSEGRFGGRNTPSTPDIGI